MSIPIHLSLYPKEPPGSSSLHYTACGVWGDYITSDAKKVECLNCRRTKRFRELKQLSYKPDAATQLHELKEAVKAFMKALPCNPNSLPEYRKTQQAVYSILNSKP